MNIAAHNLLLTYLHDGVCVDGPLSDALEESGHPLLADHFRNNKCHKAALELEGSNRWLCPYLLDILWDVGDVEAKLSKDTDHKFCVFNMMLAARYDGDEEYREKWMPNLLYKMGYTQTAICLRLRRLVPLTFDFDTMENSLALVEETAGCILAYFVSFNPRQRESIRQVRAGFEGLTQNASGVT